MLSGLKIRLLKQKKLTDKPFDVNIMLMNPQADEIMKVVAKHNVKVVTTGAGEIGKIYGNVENAGIKVMPVVALSSHGKNDGKVRCRCGNCRRNRSRRTYW